jgi:hypothetical protein
MITPCMVKRPSQERRVEFVTGGQKDSRAMVAESQQSGGR